jgi:hypothetical protein
VNIGPGGQPVVTAHSRSRRSACSRTSAPA